MPTLRIVAAVVRDDRSRWLLVRKRGTTAFMQPGGKLEAGEAPDDALVRELNEELGLVVTPEQLGHLGRFTAPAANEAGFDVDCDVYTAPLAGPVEALAEIEELRWVDVREPGDLELAPLISLLR
ncbi:NUDIX domain-containing protein [Actinoplanes sp. TFC3]|uniref:NUDIX hydrolase n=1 Tax=Actinoplanes sp. TFC3 TaxID=1710355 RepID=UPI0008333401|nr:NUDIX domain-containing protein [Actinoplanes sp. TFC3]